MISPKPRETCSTGFGIIVNTTPRITTARHCIADDYQDRAAPNNKYGTTVVYSGDGGGRVLSHAPSLRESHV